MDGFIEHLKRLDAEFQSKEERIKNRGFFVRDREETLQGIAKQRNRIATALNLYDEFVEFNRFDPE